uniref:Uncharacterized protein n=1 Tax=Chromera velia CCMP2878 TaxID=1169474 RepID=A0A0G4H9S2_9ALVE|eukprot:Cvel_6011.t1-p1 / transcript=Cvel_6011.t1 / gene=Cvel_6011 / organism=Chromera_velia_CCMP2878 / gene_product=Extensin, putative / transcript_product=Extensin, putative / location=Cvel_scaffold288:3661-7029(+) / protein_length=629 / sequence_SO=supercontig / SO=protein_coding / is_pseudo=false
MASLVPPSAAELSMFATVVVGILVRSGTEMQPNEESLRLWQEARTMLDKVGLSNIVRWARANASNWMKVMNTQVGGKPLLYCLLDKNTQPDHCERTRVVVSLLLRPSNRKPLRRLRLMDGHGRFLHAVLVEMHRRGIPLEEAKFHLVDVVTQVSDWHREFLPVSPMVEVENSNILHYCCPDCGQCNRCNTQGKGTASCSGKAHPHSPCLDLSPSEALTYLNFQSIPEEARGNLLTCLRYWVKEKGHRVLLSFAIGGTWTFSFHVDGAEVGQVTVSWSQVDKIGDKVDGANGNKQDKDIVKRWMAGPGKDMSLIEMVLLRCKGGVAGSGRRVLPKVGDTKAAGHTFRQIVVDLPKEGVEVRKVSCRNGRPSAFFTVLLAKSDDEIWESFDSVRDGTYAPSPATTIQDLVTRLTRTPHLKKAEVDALLEKVKLRGGRDWKLLACDLLESLVSGIEETLPRLYRVAAERVSAVRGALEGVYSAALKKVCKNQEKEKDAKGGKDIKNTNASSKEGEKKAQESDKSASSKEGEKKAQESDKVASSKEGGKKAQESDKSASSKEGGKKAQESDKSASSKEGEKKVQESDKSASSKEGEKKAQESDKLASSKEGEKKVQESDKSASSKEGEKKAQE